MKHMLERWTQPIAFGRKRTQGKRRTPLAPTVNEDSTLDELKDVSGPSKLEERNASISASSLISDQTAFQRSSDISDSPTSLAEALAPLHGQNVRLEDLYSRGERVGDGGYGTVETVVKRDTQQVFALKTTRAANDMDMMMLKREFACHKACHDHPNICRVYEAFEMQAENEEGASGLQIVMELCPGGNFIDWLQATGGNLAEAEVASVMEKLLSAVFYMHQRGFVHRDIKLDNVVFDEAGEPKLIDFGFARQVHPGDETMIGRYGTLSYQAPELLNESRRDGYDSSVDLWALGVTAFTLLYNKKPFDHHDREKKKRIISAARLRYFDERRAAPLSLEGKDFITRLIQREPNLRMSASAALRHPWILRHTGHMGPMPARVLSDPLVASFQSFSEASVLAKMVLEVIAFQESSLMREEIDVFSTLDADASGTISLDEFCRAMAKHPEVPKQMARKIFQDLNFSHTGQLDLSEFLAASLCHKLRGEQPDGKQPPIERLVSAAFRVLDVDSDGFITRRDLHSIFAKRLSAEQIDELLLSSGTMFDRLSVEEMVERLCDAALPLPVEASCPLDGSASGLHPSVLPVRRVRTDGKGLVAGGRGRDYALTPTRRSCVGCRAAHAAALFGSGARTQR